MPSRPGSVPSPLDGLPRPLDERSSRGRTGRRTLGLGIVAGLLAVGVFAVSAWRPSPFETFAPVGAVAALPQASASLTPGRVALPSDRVAVLAAAPTPSPTPRPAPTLRPVPTPAPVDTLTGYRWPLPRGRITLPFGPTPWGSRVVDGKKFHDGVDMATFCGDRVVAAHDGTVLAAGRHYDDQMGWIGDLTPYKERLDKKGLWSTLPIIVVVDDGNGYRSVYAHFSKVVVKKGEPVRAGQFLGYEGMTGRASGCHLHYGLFSPLEPTTFAIDPAVSKRMKLPRLEIARVDPLLVLPDRPKPTKTPSPTPPITPPP